MSEPYLQKENDAGSITLDEASTSKTFLSKLQESAPPEYRLYMIIDGAQDDEIYRMLKKFDNQADSLYALEAPEPLKAVGPWLLQLQEDDPLTSWCISRGLGSNWFIAFASKGKTMAHLRHHFRRFARVMSSKGKPMYFRYYDPRVLRAYLPSCKADERNFVFGHIPCFWTESVSTGEYLQFNSDGGCRTLDITSITGKRVDEPETPSELYIPDTWNDKPDEIDQ